MIQRVQSALLLIIAAIASFIFFVNPPFAASTTDNSDLKHNLRYKSYTSIDKGEKINVPDSGRVILLIGIIAISFCCIFFYKNLPLQIKGVLLLAVINLLLLVFLVFAWRNLNNQGKNFALQIHAAWPIILLILNSWAWFKIRTDRKTLQNLNRIR